MIFSSYEFIFLFFPTVLFCYFVISKINTKLSDLVFLLCSLSFYIVGGISTFIIFLASIFVSIVFGKLLQKNHNKYILCISILIHILLLGTFKYSNFVIENVNALLHMDIGLLHLLIPLGISFITFQQIAFLVDCHNQKIKDFKILDYCIYITYFPKIAQGPIVLFQDFISQYRAEDAKKINCENIYRGIMLFTIGLAKKVLLADTLGNFVNQAFGGAAVNSTVAIFAILAYTLQIYFDFSGYCDMAQGISQSINIKLPHNFNSPYKAVNIQDFWKRWHITLTKFLTTYLYIPLGGNRKGVARTMCHVFIVFIVSGIWHGAGYTFILWGILHGVGMVFTKMCISYINRVPKWLTWLLTFGFVNGAWLLFRSTSIHQALYFVKAIFTFDFGIISTDLTAHFLTPEIQMLLDITNLSSFSFLIPYLFIILCMWIVLCFKNSDEIAKTIRPTATKTILISLLFVWCVLSLSGIHTFIYFNF